LRCRRHSVLFLTTIGLGIALILPSSPFSQRAVHDGILLRGYDGRLLTLESNLPYSPRKTCGACHDYDRITSGYHFQEGRTDGKGDIVVRDTFSRKIPWNLSSGMFGKHGLSSEDSSQLAKKVNLSPSDIDKSSFYFVQTCGTCHPGGGPGEYDRKGNFYYNEETKKFGFELTEESYLLDGDYTPYSMGNIKFGAPWDRSGVSEADCLMCHLRGYRWTERAAALSERHFRYGPAVGAGWATVRRFEEETPAFAVEEVTLDYSSKEVADSENLNLQIVRKTPDENCWWCHAASDGRRRGRQWSPETDVHKLKGLTCITCHRSDREHNFAKGDTLQQTVRDDLDNTMHSCEDCHDKGKDRRAPRYRHPFSSRHLKRIACQTCHIPYQIASADLVYDLASTGTAIIYETSRFLSSDPLDPKHWAMGDNPGLWYPQIREYKGKIVPVKSLLVLYWGDLDETTQVVRPIPLWKIRGLNKPPLSDDDGDGIPEINTLEEIKAYLKVLKTNDPFENPVARLPVLIKGGFLYRLDPQGEVEKVAYEPGPYLDYSLSHNIVSGPGVIGARGCKDCHSKNSPFFLRKVLMDPFGEAGAPVYGETWQRLGISKDRLERLLLQQ
jgi:hypothetical protein